MLYSPGTSNRPSASVSSAWWTSPTVQPMCTCALVSVTITPALSPPHVPANTLSLAPVGVSHGPIANTLPATSNTTAILVMAPPSVTATTSSAPPAPPRCPPPSAPPPRRQN